jgi:hypothetical protein
LYTGRLLSETEKHPSSRIKHRSRTHSRDGGIGYNVNIDREGLELSGSVFE